MATNKQVTGDKDRVYVTCCSLESINHGGDGTCMFKYQHLMTYRTAAIRRWLCTVNSARMASAVVAWVFFIPVTIFAADEKKTSDFEASVLPLFQAKCVKCHGATNSKGELDLASISGLRRGGESGSVIKPGNAKESSLFEKLTSGEMPPDKSEALTAEQIEVVRQWIDSGAKSADDSGDPSNSDDAVTQHDVIPIFLRRCIVCHGSHRQEGGLDLRTRETILLGGKSGPALVLNDPDHSRLLQRIRAGEMPPPDRLVEASVKPVEPSELNTLTRWISAGAPEVDASDDTVHGTNPAVSDKSTDKSTDEPTDERSDLWSFKSPQQVDIPNVRNKERVRNPIDAFVLQKLEEQQLSFAPEADKEILLRRVTFDLTGLPPTPDEIKAFIADESPQSYATVVDRLLQSPHYGERMARSWLDLAGYADSEGKREQDLPRPHAWRYRDYVIRSMNADKPYDRFLLEQIAGDELADYEHASVITDEIYDNLVATGFLRMAPDPTWANITSYLNDRIDVMADEMDIFGSGVMGLTFKCARCHSHKFDPISQRDYYQLVDIFKGAMDEHDWLKPDIKPGIGPVSSDSVPPRLLRFVTTSEQSAWEKNDARISEAIKAIPADQDSASAEQMRQKLAAERNPPPMIHALWDRGQPSPTYLYRRGDPMNSGPLVHADVPAFLKGQTGDFEIKPPWTDAESTGRRLAFAKWLIQPGHPLTARVAVNRIWKQHFGKGIVASLGNFGHAGERPTHPELLDWLAVEFTKQGWSMKAMHRLMVMSATYRQQSIATPEQLKLDPDNPLYSRMPMIRLDAESIYDAMLSASGQLDSTPFGPPDEIDVRADGLVTPRRLPNGWRRLIYVSQQRKNIVTHRENFDFPQMNPNCLDRRDSLVAPQALHLLNNGMVRQLAESFATRVMKEAGDDCERQVDLVSLYAIGRPLASGEKNVSLDAMQAFVTELKTGSSDIAAVKLKALTEYCHAVFNSAAFLFVD